jgi:hypothetical protein
MASIAATLRRLTRRIRELTTEAADHRQAILGLVRAWRPDLLTRPSVGPIVARHRAVRLVPYVARQLYRQLETQPAVDAA